MKYHLRLYVVSETPNSLRAIENLRRICDQDLEDEYELEVIDILKQPQLAEEDKIIAVPTLVRALPLPFHRIIGDLSDLDQVLLGLDIVRAKKEA